MKFSRLALYKYKMWAVILVVIYELLIYGLKTGQNIFIYKTGIISLATILTIVTRIVYIAIKRKRIWFLNSNFIKKGYKNSGVHAIRRGYISEKQVFSMLQLYGSPLFVGFEKLLNQKLDLFENYKNSISKRIKLAYSVKTNNLLYLLQYFHSRNILIEVVSKMEYEMVKQVGFGDRQIILNGPSIEKETIESVISKGGMINIENLFQLNTIINFVKSHNFRVGIGLRIKTYNNHKYSRFGFNYSELNMVIRIIRKTPRLYLKGVHIHVGSNVSSPKVYSKNSQRLVGWLKSLNKEDLDELEYVDLGGGFPVEGSLHSDLQVHTYNIGKFIFSAIKPLQDTDRFKNVEIIFEPGRWLVDQAFVLVSTVISVSIDDGRQNITCDASINILPLALTRDGIIEIIPKIRSKKAKDLFSTTIFGSSCSEDDCLAFNVKLKKVNMGDLLIFGNAGAYNIPKSNQFSKLRPGIVVIDKSGNILEARKQESSNNLWFHGGT